MEKALTEKLRALLGGVRWLKDWEVEREPITADRSFDLKANLRLSDGNRADLWVVCKANPRPHQFPYIRVQDQSSPQGKRLNRLWVLAAPFISPRMAQLCQEHGWSWFDLAGKCYLSS